MRCPYCQHTDTKVLDSRLTESDSIRRRRECLSCEKRFTTYERVEIMDISVVKRDSRREPFAREKIMKGLLRACEKRPIKREEIEELATHVESAVRQMDKTEIKSALIGELIMERLRSLDDVAYVRFASVYKKFKDANQFVDVIKNLKTKKVIVEVNE